MKKQIRKQFTLSKLGLRQPAYPSLRLVVSLLAFLVLLATDARATEFSKIHDFDGPNGATPYAGLVKGADGALCGTTVMGGTSDAGTVFRINEDGTGFSTIHYFPGDLTNGANPFAGLLKGPRPAGRVRC